MQFKFSFKLRIMAAITAAGAGLASSPALATLGLVDNYNPKYKNDITVKFAWQKLDSEAVCSQLTYSNQTQQFVGCIGQDSAAGIRGVMVASPILKVGNPGNQQFCDYLRALAKNETTVHLKITKGTVTQTSMYTGKTWNDDYPMVSSFEVLNAQGKVVKTLKTALKVDFGRYAAGEVTCPDWQ